MTPLTRSFIAISGLFLLFAGCAPRIYRPPALGAEYRFDEGLKPQKPKQRLFDKGQRKYLEKQGMVGKESDPKMGLTATGRKDSTAHPAAADSVSRDTLTNPVPPASPASPDSSHSGPH